MGDKVNIDGVPFSDLTGAVYSISSEGFDEMPDWKKKLGAYKDGLDASGVGKPSKNVRDDLDAYIAKYGAIPKGERPVRDIQVPKRTSKDKKLSQTVRTVMEARATPDAMLPDIEQLTAEDAFSYDENTQSEGPEVDYQAFLYGLDSTYERSDPECQRSHFDVARSKTSIPEKVETYGAIRYHEDGRIIVTDDWRGKEHPKVLKNYKPNAVVDTLSLNGKQWDRTIYDAEGTMKMQIHGGNHGNPKRHSSGKHVHDYTWHSGIDKPDRTERKASILEMIQHADVLGGEDNDD